MRNHFPKNSLGNISVTLSLANTTAIKDLTSTPSSKSEDRIYSLNGQRVTNPSHGIYIKNGKKTIL